MCFKDYSVNKPVSEDEDESISRPRLHHEDKILLKSMSQQMDTEKVLCTVKSITENERNMAYVYNCLQQDILKNMWLSRTEDRVREATKTPMNPLKELEVCEMLGRVLSQLKLFESVAERKKLILTL